jgi:hypothetical protein
LILLIAVLIFTLVKQDYINQDGIDLKNNKLTVKSVMETLESNCEYGYDIILQKVYFGRTVYCDLIF